MIKDGIGKIGDLGCATELPSNPNVDDQSSGGSFDLEARDDEEQVDAAEKNEETPGENPFDIADGD